MAHTRRRGDPSWGGERVARPRVPVRALPKRERAVESMLDDAYDLRAARRDRQSRGGAGSPSSLRALPRGVSRSPACEWEAAWTWLRGLRRGHAVQLLPRVERRLAPHGRVHAVRVGAARRRAVPGVSAFRAGSEAAGRRGCAAESRENGWMGLANEWAEEASANAGCLPVRARV